MQTQTNSQAQAIKERFSLLEYNGNKVAIKEINGTMMINATQMAKPFGKQPIEWLRFQHAKDLIETVSKVRNHSLADLKVVKRGGNNPGTWFQEDVALFFAQWLSPEFYLACNMKLKELAKTQSLELPPKYGVQPIAIEGMLMYPYAIAVRILGHVKTGATNRKKIAPQHFRILFGRNFVTEQYLDVLKGYYDWKNSTNQLTLDI